MNLKPLFDKQRELDERIIKEKGLEGQDLLPKKILALQVELGELANEWRGFKFWSERQKPRRIYSIVRDDDEADFWKCGNGLDCNKKFDEPFDVCPECGWDTVLPYKEKNPLLEEYVDCLHFILSIGLEVGYNNFRIDVEFPDFKVKAREKTIIETLNMTIHYANWMADDDYYHELQREFLDLGSMLGFTWEQIEKAYMEKNAVNHQRQSNGY